MGEKTVSLWTPILYVSTLIIALVVFSKIYRARKFQKLAETPQFYPQNFAKDIYQQLKTTEKVPAKLLKAALLGWAAEDLLRVLRFRESELPVQGLLQNGIVGEDLFETFSGSKILTERELQEIALEAESLQPGWGSAALQAATEIAQQHAVRRRVSQLDVFKREFKEIVGLQLGDESTIGKKTEEVTAAK